ncbi:hypothetical protein SISNIDRAFT_453045 [Sistotremastrum niveocremeum HHB9708]|uniref:Uncharacterized protein n=1 Tax=Sistotremastrum niveocremeum HHB9708 TaxID=1314777 RepID=A0A164WAJ7_9AGAM|nr:hypothetical protein SISNIDRAFT_453045 [Sistotremastrum niveocremeum HHB9708]
MTAGQTDRERDLEYQAITMDIGAVPPYLFEKHPQEENEVVRDIICFSVLSRSSFEAIEIRRVIWERRKLLYPTLLVALDTDYRWDAEAFHREHSERSSSGPVLTHEGERLAYDLGAFAYLECSSRNPSEVKKVFQEACKFVSRPDRKGGCLVQ